MKDLFGAITLALLALFIGFNFGKNFTRNTENEIIDGCGYDKDMIIETYNDWVNESLKEADKIAEKHPVKAVDVIGIMEYNTTPKIMKQPLYDDFKNSRVCKATLLVNYTPNEEKETIEEIDIRFQKTDTAVNEQGEYRKNIFSSGYDVETMREQALEFFKKHNKDKK